MPGARTGRRLGAHERALGLLTVRARSGKEIRDRLRRASFEEGEVEAVLERLEAVGLIDDERFAREYTEQAVRLRGDGRRAVAAALLAKGVARETVDTVLEEVGGGEETRATELARARARRLEGLPPEVAFRRLVGFLGRRGYEGPVARECARRALSPAGGGGPDEAAEPLRERTPGRTL